MGRLQGHPEFLLLGEAFPEAPDSKWPQETQKDIWASVETSGA